MPKPTADELLAAARELYEEAQKILPSVPKDKKGRYEREGFPPWIFDAKDAYLWFEKLAKGAPKFALPDWVRVFAGETHLTHMLTTLSTPTAYVTEFVKRLPSEWVKTVYKAAAQYPAAMRALGFEGSETIKSMPRKPLPSEIHEIAAKHPELRYWASNKITDDEGLTPSSWEHPWAANLPEVPAEEIPKVVLDAMVKAASSMIRSKAWAAAKGMMRPEVAEQYRAAAENANLLHVWDEAYNETVLERERAENRKKAEEYKLKQAIIDAGGAGTPEQVNLVRSFLEAMDFDVDHYGRDKVEVESAAQWVAKHLAGRADAAVLASAAANLVRLTPAKVLSRAAEIAREAEEKEAQKRATIAEAKERLDRLLAEIEAMPPEKLFEMGFRNSRYIEAGGFNDFLYPLVYLPKSPAYDFLVLKHDFNNQVGRFAADYANFIKWKTAAVERVKPIAELLGVLYLEKAERERAAYEEQRRRQEAERKRKAEERAKQPRAEVRGKFPKRW